MKYIGVLTGGGEAYVLIIKELPKDEDDIPSLIEAAIGESESNFQWQVLLSEVRGQPSPALNFRVLEVDI